MTAKFTHLHTVTFDETNLVGNVYFAHFLHWQGHCREMFLAQHAPGVLAALHAGEFALATVRCHMEFYAECFALEDIEVAMTLRRQSGNRIGMDFNFFRRDVLVACGGQEVACLRRTKDGLLPIPVPIELDQALEYYRGTTNATTITPRSN